MKRRLLLTLSFLFVLGNHQSASAASVNAWTLDPVQNFSNGSWSFGQIFTVGSQNIAVTSLGAFDADLDGFSTTAGIPVGIFRESDGALLASATVNSGDTLDGHFRFVDIPDLLLMANTDYRVVAVSRNDEYNISTNNWTLDPAITLGDYGYCSTTSLTKCDDHVGNDYIWMANFKFGERDVQLSEPASLVLLGFGLLGLGLIRRKRG